MSPPNEGARFHKIDYAKLNSKQKEIYNFQKVAAVLADYGFNCIKLADDWLGADFIAYHRDAAQTLRVQLKSRLTIEQKYIGKDLFVTFPVNGYLPSSVSSAIERIRSVIDLSSGGGR